MNEKPIGCRRSWWIAYLVTGSLVLPVAALGDGGVRTVPRCQESETDDQCVQRIEEDLNEDLISSDRGLRNEALYDLLIADTQRDQKVSTERGIRIVKEGLFSNDPNERALAGRHLRFLPKEAVDRKLLDRLGELAAMRQPVGVNGLALFGEAKDRDLLRGLFDQEADPHWRSILSRALARLGDERQRDFWLERLRSMDPRVCSSGVAATAFIGDPRAIPLLYRIIQDPESDRLDLDPINSTRRFAQQDLMTTLYQLGWPRPDLDLNWFDKNSPARWKAWWAVHQSEIERLIAEHEAERTPARSR